MQHSWWCSQRKLGKGCSSGNQRPCAGTPQAERVLGLGALGKSLPLTVCAHFTYQTARVSLQSRERRDHQLSNSSHCLLLQKSFSIWRKTAHSMGSWLRICYGWRKRKNGWGFRCFCVHSKCPVTVAVLLPSIWVTPFVFSKFSFHGRSLSPCFLQKELSTCFWPHFSGPGSKKDDELISVIDFLKGWTVHLIDSSNFLKWEEMVCAHKRCAYIMNFQMYRR